MNNDELLALIDKEVFTIVSVNDPSDIEIARLRRLKVALRAVVELHKPVQGRSDISTYDYVGCDACVEWSHDGNMNLRYPCPTIQAITDNLK